MTLPHLDQGINLALRRGLPALTAGLLMLGALWPQVWLQPMNGDESHYAWTAAYYGGLVSRGYWQPDGTDSWLDPGWSPTSYWALTQPMGTRAIYALALGLTQYPAPEHPWDWTRRHEPQPEAQFYPITLAMLRLTAAACAALGAAFIGWRLGWPWLSGLLPWLWLEHARIDLAKVWAEGPLILGFGLCIVTFGTRWFGIACGLAATIKLTALGVWPLLLWPRANGARGGVLIGMASAATIWTILTPPSWWAGGPAYLIPMLLNRQAEQAVNNPYAVIGFHWPTRYWIPIELACAVGIALALPWLAAYLHQVRRRRTGASITLITRR